MVVNALDTFFSPVLYAESKMMFKEVDERLIITAKVEFFSSGGVNSCLNILRKRIQTCCFELTERSLCNPLMVREAFERFDLRVDTLSDGYLIESINTNETLRGYFLSLLRGYDAPCSIYAQ